MLHVATHSGTKNFWPIGQPDLSSSQCFTFNKSFPLRFGGTLKPLKIAFESHGPKDGPVLVVQGGISASRHICSSISNHRPGWWETMVGPGLAIDTSHYRVICFDYLGGNGASSSPKDLTGESFPTVTTDDQAQALAWLLDALKIETIEAFIGASYGGMVGFAFAQNFAARLKKLIAIAAPCKPAPMALAWRIIQRQIVRFGQRFNNAEDALAIARGLAMTTYRTATEFSDRFDGPPALKDGGYSFPLESYLENCGTKFVRDFHPQAFLTLSESLDLHHVEPEAVEVPTQLIGFLTDQLVPFSQLEVLSKQLAGRTVLTKIDSEFGHDGFLKETEILTHILQGALETPKEVC